MLREQQKELRESYNLSAACKLLVVVGRRGATSLALALGAWRWTPDGWLQLFYSPLSHTNMHTPKGAILRCSGIMRPRHQLRKHEILMARSRSKPGL